jgi:polysaccharide chain length determinant protein (PEP-CTERM system associated)
MIGIRMQTEAIKPEIIIDMVIRRRWFIIIPLCLSMIAGIFLSVNLPREYQAETLILVEPQRVPRDYVQSIVSSDLDARISTISQQIMSRTNLDNIIKTYNLFSGPKHEKMYAEDKIKNMRKRISVKVTRARRGAEAFSISFMWPDREIVVNVANTLATFFIDQNLKVREAQAVGTSNFLDGELNSMEIRLIGVEENLKKYREKYMGELPEQLETNLRILDNLQAQLIERQLSLRDEKNSLIVLETRISGLHNPNVPDGVVQEGTESPLSLDSMKGQLADLESRYTHQHPDVIRLKRKIADLEKKNDQMAMVKKGEPPPDLSTPRQRRIDENMRQLEDKRLAIKRLEAIISELNSKIIFYQKRVENTPKREQELMSLNRDYSNIRQTYNSLLSRKLESEIAVNMEKKQKGEQFRILDSAKLPEKPVSPNMNKLFFLSLAAGLSIGAGLIFLLEYLNTSFATPKDIEDHLGCAVLAVVPEIYQPKDLKWQRLNHVLSIFAVMLSFALFVGFAVLTVKGVDQTILLMVRFFKL